MILTRVEIMRMMKKWQLTSSALELRENAVNLAETALAAMDHADALANAAIRPRPFFDLRGEDFRRKTPEKQPASLSDLCRNCGGFSQTLRIGKPWTCDECGAVR